MGEQVRLDLIFVWCVVDMIIGVGYFGDIVCVFWYVFFL